MRLLDALADPTRLRIVRLLAEAELAMGELADVLGQSQPRVSRHVRILAEAGLVRRAKEGSWVFVGAARGPAADAAATFVAAVTDPADLAPERARLAGVRAARQTAAERWFAEHADEWERMRALDGAADAVDSALAHAVRGAQSLLDVGTGTGRLLAAVDAPARVGVDRSPDMLRLARARIDRERLPAEVRQADMASLPFADAAFDAVVMNQVLHYADAPEQAVGEAARVVAPGGRLLIADYLPHEHDELRRDFAHAWAGFEPRAVSGWMEAAGLRPRELARHAGARLTSAVWEGTR